MDRPARAFKRTGWIGLRVPSSAPDGSACACLKRTGWIGLRVPSNAPDGSACA
jgi:hypothetical protein